MTPIAGFIIAAVAGWVVRDAWRAAVTVAVPWLAVLIVQTWVIAAGRATSPPGTVSKLPQAVGYWLIQAVFFALALGIAAQLGALRARRALPRKPGSTGRKAIAASALLAAATAGVLTAAVLDSSPVHHHSADGSPPAWGVIGMALCLVTFAVLSAMTLRRRRAMARTDLAGAGTKAPAASAPK